LTALPGEPFSAAVGGDRRSFKRRLDRFYGLLTVGFLVFVFALAIGESLGLSRNAIGIIFLMASVALYAGIGVISRTNDATEYYVAGRRVPAFYNGMATAADWLSAASFIGLAGSLYLSGFADLAFILGWTGGFCLVAMLLAPYLRRFGQFTVPDFLGARYEGHLARLVGVGIAVTVSFVYLVAQIYAVGLITSRLSGVAFEIGIFVGLGGVLVCSFLGGMRAVTWTQAAQYIVLMLAFLVPLIWLSVKQTGSPVPQLTYGQQLAQITARETELINDPAEQEVMAYYAEQSRLLGLKLADVPTALAADRAAAQAAIEHLRKTRAPADQIRSAVRRAASLPKTEAAALEEWTRAKLMADQRSAPLAGMPRQALAFEGNPAGDAQQRQAYETSRRNFLALVFSLMLGTAALPHILVRFYTTPSAREARQSVAWSLLFIGLFYFSVPALAVMIKYEVFNGLVGTPIDQLPSWMASWGRADPGLLSFADVNQDGLLQLGELRIDADMFVLATPEMVGLPYVISGMVAAGGLAAALSTADGLLLTITNALSHDVYHRIVDPQARTARRVLISKVLLLFIAVGAAYVAYSVYVRRQADILFLVSAAFSLAAAGLFPALVLGIFWRRTTRWGAVCGMVSGFVLTLYYMIINQPWLRSVFGVHEPVQLWWGIEPMAAGALGAPLGFAVTLLVSWVTPRPGPAAAALVDRLRVPGRAEA
jgi:cation/acetate symporter